MQFPYEKQAMRGEPMPKDLSLADQMAYQTLASMHSRFRIGAITREQGADEKKTLSYTYNRAVEQREREVNLLKYHAELNTRIEHAANAYAKNRTIENADLLYKALYGMMPSEEERRIT